MKNKFHTIDSALLVNLEEWQKKLANNIYKNNSGLIDSDFDLLGKLAQRVLDRIIFTRTLEDRKIIPPSIHSILKGTDIYTKLHEHYKQFHSKYKGLIFNEHKIDNIIIEDKILKEILINICHTNGIKAVYQFDQIPVEIFGSIYERFLGKSLYFDSEKKDNSFVLKNNSQKKYTGTYYTPDYIVDYICENTIGKMFHKKTPEQVKDIKIIDIACGSGNFLVGAYSYLLNWYENYYNENPDESKEDTIELKQKIDRTFKMNSRKKLTPKAKKRILAQHIYGLDLDNQAVEISKMSLILKMLEGDFELPEEREEFIIPNLVNNIICGNALNWEKYFPSIIKWEVTTQGERMLAEGYGFDIIIGNPPYVKQYTNNKIFEDLKTSYIFRYYEGKMDYWYLFACQAIDLLKINGLHSYIATSNWNTSTGSSHFRNKLLNETKLISIIDFLDYKVFSKAGIQTMIYITKKTSVTKEYNINYLKFLKKEIPKSIVSETLTNFDSLANETNDIYTKYVAQINTKKIKNNIFTFNNKMISDILTKILQKHQFKLLKTEVAQGIVGGPDKAFIIYNINNLNKHELKYIKTYYTCSERYITPQSKGFILYINKENFKTLNKEMFPNIYANIIPYKDKLKNRRETKTGQIQYFQLHWHRNEKFFSTGEKIVCSVKTKYPKFYFTESPFYGSRALNFIKTDRINNKYLTALFNSNISYFYFYFFGKKQGEQLQIDKGPLLSMPIVRPNESEIKVIVKLYEQMNSYIQDYSKVQNKKIKNEIEKVDRKMNHIFYEIYELTKKDIEVIETSLPPYEFL